MPFDATIAIAKLELATGTDRPDLDNLRARYPELGFVFDLLEDKLPRQRTARSSTATSAARSSAVISRTSTQLECRVQDMRLAFGQIRELTVDAEITNIIEDAL
jgi:hypothetical protein